MLQDYKLGLRMLLKYPGLTLAGGLALAIAIGIGAGWYDVVGKVFAPTIYARTATREGEIAVRSALGASRARIMSQLFVEALVLTFVAAPVGLIAADRALAWGIESANRASGGAPFWMTPGLKLAGADVRGAREAHRTGARRRRDHLHRPASGRRGRTIRRSRVFPWRQAGLRR